jgi:hypothetical protein
MNGEELFFSEKPMMVRFEYNHFLVDCEQFTSILEAICRNFIGTTLKSGLFVWISPSQKYCLKIDFG